MTAMSMMIVVVIIGNYDHEGLVTIITIIRTFDGDGKN
jgi:hypothetical protein